MWKVKEQKAHFSIPYMPFTNAKIHHLISQIKTMLQNCFQTRLEAHLQIEKRGRLLSDFKRKIFLKSSEAVFNDNLICT